MEHKLAYRPAKPRIRLLPVLTRRRAAPKLPGQLFTDWAAI